MRVVEGNNWDGHSMERDTVGCYWLTSPHVHGCNPAFPQVSFHIRPLQIVLFKQIMSLGRSYVAITENMQTRMNILTASSSPIHIRMNLKDPSRLVLFKQMMSLGRSYVAITENMQTRMNILTASSSPIHTRMNLKDPSRLIDPNLKLDAIPNDVHLT
jgi:hypothetical protein